jgi:hypothetical protein
MNANPRHSVALTCTNCQTTDLSIGRLFQGESLFNLYPGLKHPTSQSLRRGCFLRHLLQHEGRHSFSDGGLRSPV